MKKIFIAYHEGSYATIFWDQDNNLITSIHENDGSWRDEYMNKILEHFDVKVERVKEIPQIIKDKIVNYE